MIIPAILEKDVQEVLRKISLIKPVAPVVSIDIIDGRFVDTKTVTLQELYEAGAHEQGVALEFDLMVADPSAHFELCQQMQAKRVFWHYRAAPDITRMVAESRRFGFKKGVAIDPETPIEGIGNDCGRLDAVQIMGVHPGRQGAEFISETMDRVRQLRKRFGNLPIVVDGGVGKGNVRELLAAGATDLVVGSAIFGCDDPIACYNELRTLVS